jgi:acetolactate synthase-1/2/3 large subunit
VKAYEAVVKCLTAEDCGAVFGLMGDGNMQLWAALAQGARPALYSVRHEAAAVSMADGYAQETGQVGVATVTCGPGLTHVATPLLAAGRAQTPLVVITGQVAAADRHNTQHLNQQRFVEACEAHFLSPTGPNDVPRIMSEAFFHARVRRQPVVINLPNDLQQQQMNGTWDYRPSSTWLPHHCELAPAASLDLLAHALVLARRPVIVAGRGARGAREAIIGLGERIGALMGTTLLAKDLFHDHPFNIGIMGGYVAACVKPLLAECDFVLAIGAKLGFDTAGKGGLLFPNAQVARIDLAPAPGDISVLPGGYFQGDAGATAQALSDLCDRRNVHNSGFQTDEVRAALHSNLLKWPQPGDGLDPRTVMRSVSAALPDGLRVTVGGGHFWNFPVVYLSLPKDARVTFTYPFGSIGAALAMGMGVQVGSRKQPSLVIDGDGSLLQHIQELETAARYRLPIVLLLMNDSGYGAEAHKLRASGLDGASACWESPDFVAIARAFGGQGVCVTQESQIAAALADGFRAEGPFVIDVRISPSIVSERYQELYFGAGNANPLIRPEGRYRNSST